MRSHLCRHALAVLLCLAPAIAAPQAPLKGVPDVVVTPSGPSIQAAIDLLKDTGGTIYLTAGTYVVTAPVDLSDTSGLTLQGDGVATIIRPEDGLQAFNALYATGAQDLTIKNLAIDGNKDMLSPPVSFEFGSGIFIKDSSDVIVENVKAHHCATYGILLMRVFDGGWIRGCHVEKNGGMLGEAGDGIQLYRCRGVHVVDNHVERNHWAGIQLTWGDGAPDLDESSNIVANNSVLANRCHGIVVYANNATALEGNTIRGLYEEDLGCPDTPEMGILIQSKATSISNNTIAGVERGILLWHIRGQLGAYGSTETVIDGNTIREVDNDCIQVLRDDLDAGASTATISNNDLSQCGYFGIAVYRSPGQNITGNRIHDTQHSAVLLKESGESVFSSNVCYDNGQSPDPNTLRSAITLSGPSDNIVLLGNVARTSQEYGISCVASANTNLIVGNNLTSNPAGAINCPDASNVVVGVIPDTPGRCDVNNDESVNAEDVSAVLNCLF